MDTYNLSNMEIDAVGEILNISLGASATAVSTMLDTRVDITTPVVKVKHKDEFEFASIEPAVGVQIGYVEGLDGSNIMLLKRIDVKVIVELLMGMEIPDDQFELDEMNISAICEVMNQMMGAAATSMSTMLGKMIDISPPEANLVDMTDSLDEKEIDSWIRLTRVLTHEIMNTVTPIASLSETLLQFDKVDDEIRNGLDSISQSSRGLIRFVESYRNLTRVAAPVKKAFFVRDMAERVINLTKEQASEAGATCTYIEKSEDILLYADEGQISQIIINLVKNAIQAEADKIEITAEINLSECVIINVFNNGTPISKDSQDEIFIPFFTTKQDGTGIGLSLSRQIMRLHNGSLNLTRSDVNGTVFTLAFK